MANRANQCNPFCSVIGCDCSAPKSGSSLLAEITAVIAGLIEECGHTTEGQLYEGLGKVAGNTVAYRLMQHVLQTLKQAGLVSLDQYPAITWTRPTP